MSAPVETSESGRGAQRRRGLHERRSREEARRWLAQPGVLLFLAVVALAAAGWWLLARAAHRVPVEQASLDGLDLQLEQATWIEDQMDHGQGVQKPASMSPDMPGPGMQRVTLHMAFQNHSGQAQDFRGEEFFLVPEIGEDVPPFGAVVGEARLEPGQTLNTALHFDVDTRQPHGKLLMKWQRGRRTAYFPIPEAPEHYHLRPRGGDVALPNDARLLLPIADADRGERLYAQVYGCSACHGDPHVAGSNNIGPHLGNIGQLAESRVKGQPAPQYLYESILQPDAFIAPDCKGAPCQSPSAMPEYSSLVNLQDAADLLAYLLELKG